jgi:hypothetical protein
VCDSVCNTSLQISHPLPKHELPTCGRPTADWHRRARFANARRAVQLLFSQWSSYTDVGIDCWMLVATNELISATLGEAMNELIAASTGEAVNGPVSAQIVAGLNELISLGL